jgi:sugar lactone lactonase YvrE
LIHRSKKGFIMKKSLAATVVAVLTAFALGGFPGTATAAPALVTAQVVTTFAPGEGGAFAESMTADGHGRLIVSLTQWGVQHADGSWTDNHGQLYRFSSDGTQTAYGPLLSLGACSQLMGVTVDAARVYVTVGNFDPSCGSSSLPSGVLRVNDNTVTRVLTMPAGTFANGLAIHNGLLYVTDSYSGSVWSGPTDRPTAPTRPWFSSAKLAPTGAISLGANGIAYRDGALYVTGYARGYVLAIRTDHLGRPADSSVVAHDSRLERADGIAFDGQGRLWVTVNPAVDLKTMTQNGEGALVVIDSGGHVNTVATPPQSLDYPTQPVALGDAIFVTNGSFFHGTPTVVKFMHLA